MRLKERSNLTKSPMKTYSVIEAETRTQRCRQQVNAIITVFHVRKVNTFTGLFKNAGSWCFVCVWPTSRTLTSQVVGLHD